MFNLFKKEKNQIVIVSGLPRSGTSMMMKMLEAGGVSPLTDQVRKSDDDNLKGYYEFERVKALEDGDVEWLNDAKGKAVKVISALLEFLPKNHSYQVIFMRRNISEILASQNKMLENRGVALSTDLEQEQMSKIFSKHLMEALNFLSSNDAFNFIEVDYNQLIKAPEIQVQLISKFLNNQLDINEMLGVIDPNMYRQRIQ